MKSLLALSCAALAVCAPATATAAAPSAYTVAVRTTYINAAVGIDELGDVAYTAVQGSNGSSLLRADGRTITLNAPQSTDVLGVSVSGLSSRGRSAGSYDAIIYGEGDDPQTHTRAVSWTRDGASTALATPPGADSGAAAVNDSGVVVGRITDAQGTRAVSWSRGRATYLGPYGSSATDIDNAGTVVGSIGATAADRTAVLFDGHGGFRTFALLSGATASAVTDLAPTGAAVGTTTVTGKAIPTYWDTAGAAHRLPGTAVPLGINAANVVVGSGGVVWATPTSIPTALPHLPRTSASSGSDTYSAVDVNDKGVVLGSCVVRDSGGVDGPGRDYVAAVTWTRS